MLVLLGCTVVVSYISKINAYIVFAINFKVEKSNSWT